MIDVLSLPPRVVELSRGTEFIVGGGGAGVPRGSRATLGALIDLIQSEAAELASSSHSHGLADLDDVTGPLAYTAGRVLRANGSAYVEAQLGHGDLDAIGSNSHAAIDSHIAAANPHSGSAPTGHTHAASAITSGTLAHERGGLEADVSAYAGLVKIAGGATSAVAVTAAGEAILDDADAAAQRTTLGLVAAGAGDIWVEKAGDTMTGNLTLGGNSLVTCNNADIDGDIDLEGDLNIAGNVNMETTGKVILFRGTVGGATEFSIGEKVANTVTFTANLGASWQGGVKFQWNSMVPLVHDAMNIGGLFNAFQDSYWTGFHNFKELASDPSTPATGQWRLYFKSGGLYHIDDTGSVTGPLS